ncbi:MAG: DMT family transporter, partial [Proteobacteria bacterium]|nr:DMT family transporter [Pseudomonadota bacterium]
MLTADDKKGIALCILSTICIALQDIMSKKLLGYFSIGQIIFVRQVVFLFFAIWWLSRRHGIGNFFSAFRRASNIPMQILRSSLMVLEIAVFFSALRYVGVAEAHAVFMLFPILATLLAWLLLGEALTKRKLIALFLGFIGALLIIRPGSQAFEPALLIVLCAAFLFALYNVLTRRATARDGFDISLVYMATVGLLWSIPVGVTSWESNVPPQVWLLLALVTVTGIVVHLLIVKSLEYAPASLLQPYNYTLIGWAMLFAWLFYGELLDALHIVGIAIVLAAGLYMLGSKKKKLTVDKPLPI